MPNAVPLFLKLLFAHVAGDFLFQTARIATGKHQRGVLLWHLGIHAALLVGVALTEPFDFALVIGLVTILAAHAAIDAWTSRIEPRTVSLLVLDQSLHVLSLGAAVAIARPEDFEAARWWLSRALQDPRVFVTLAGFVIAVWVGAVLVGRWAEPFARAIVTRLGEDRPGLERAGRAIGMFERAIIFLAMMLRIESLIGFVIAAKAILRLPEARERGSRELAEYYLVGSLASVFWAVLAGVLTRWMVSGVP
jgi:hypothetical protein